MNPLLFQIADSAFPVGGFVHSGGLEAAARLGLVGSVDALGQWLSDGLWQAGHGVLPLVGAGWDDHPSLDALADLCEAFLVSPPANRASRTQGQAWIGTVAGVFPSPALAALKRQVRADPRRGHLAPLLGRVCALIGCTREETLHLALFHTLRGQISTAVRLGLVGPIEGQRQQAALSPHLAAVVAGCRDLTLDDLCTTAPLADLAQTCHDRLYSRMFAT